MEQGKHVIFYRQQQRGKVLISRILHQRRLPGEQAINDTEG
jgi:plasmid stabilization system protein ParE